MPTAYIVDCVRTAGGRRNGTLSQVHPGDLGAACVDALVKRTGMNPALVDDVIFGCVSQVGAQGANIARTVVLSSCLPETVPATSVDRQCGSSQQAIHFAAQAVMSGTQDIVIAGGVEVMSQVPIGASVMDGASAGHGVPMSEGMKKRYPAYADEPTFSQFHGAEMMAKQFKCSREEMEKFATQSHLRAAAATKSGAFKNEIVPVMGTKPKSEERVELSVDEGIRPNTTPQGLAKLKPVAEGGVITAGVASQITDGAAAVLICNEEGLKKLKGIHPRAKITAIAMAGDDPVIMLRAIIPATENVLKKANLKIGDIGLFEVNEAFASVPLGWIKALNVDQAKVNVNGGAIALGHPLGGSGAKLMTTLVNAMEQRGAKYGLQTMCEGGGMANATIIELCGPKAKL